MIRRREAAASVAGTSSWPDESWLKGLPTICEHLTQETYEDGTSRELSKVSISYQDGLVLAALNDGDQRQSLYRSGEGVQAALKALEKALASPGADWRSWGGKKGKK